MSLLVMFGLVIFLTACEQNGAGGQSAAGTHDHDHEHDDGHTHDHGDDDGHDHDHDGDHQDKTPGPNGGRLVEAPELNFEILIKDNRSIMVTLLDGELKPADSSGYSVSGFTGQRSNPIKLNFTRQENGQFVSVEGIPEGNSLPTIINIHEGNLGNLIFTERFNANLSTCPTCDYQEYACICHDH